MQTNTGMFGEFRVVVKREDGSIKTDTGYQKNLILNQGLDFFGSNNGSDMMAYCVIGSGNSTPAYTQNKLDAAIIGVSGSTNSTKYDYDASRDGNLYKTNRVCKYSFSNLNNANISEVGLASTYSNATTYYLCTRALIKDSQGNPTTITVLSGEILEIYYKLWAVYDTTDKTGQINLLDGVGGSTAYNYKLRLAGVGNNSYYSVRISDYRVGMAADFVANSGGSKNNYFYAGDIASITDQNPTTELDSFADQRTASNYANGSYKRVFTITANTGQINGNIRSMLLNTYLGSWQIRFGSVTDDSPIKKTNTQTLSIPVEFSWGRYEGAL